MATGGKPKKKNPRLASGRKRARQDVKINAANSSLRSKYRTAVKNVEKAVVAGDKAKATELFAKAQSIVDAIADKGIFHKNKAARDKSRLSAKVKALAWPLKRSQDLARKGPALLPFKRVRCSKKQKPPPGGFFMGERFAAGHGALWGAVFRQDAWAGRAAGRPRPPAGRCRGRSSSRSPRPWARHRAGRGAPPRT